MQGSAFSQLHEIPSEGGGGKSVVEKKKSERKEK